MSDGSGAPPMITVAAPVIVVPTIGPSGGSLGRGVENRQWLVTSMDVRAARAPSIQTDAEPRNTSKNGKYPPHHTPSPKSPQRAANDPSITVVDAPETY